jgi:release factor glutamine methyltransferase
MPTTIKQLLSSASKIIDRLDAEVLLAHVLSKPREFLISHDTDTVGLLGAIKFKRLVKKRSQNYPAAQLTKTKGFFGYEFEVNKHTLIPRPDTEMMVEEVVDRLRTTDSGQQIILIDVGTGSGCIPIAIAKQITNYRLQSYFYASDISKQALRVAKRNAKKHNVQITFKHGNLLMPWQSTVVRSQSSIIITANLPYLTEHQFTTEPSIQHEPKSALVAENEGLALYEELLQQIVSYSMPNVTCYLEIDPTQSEKIQSLIKKHIPSATFDIKKDLAGLDRIVKVDIV